MFGFFKKYDVHLCPEVKGQILKEGKAVAGTEVIRSLTYVDNKERIDSVKTDNEGYFIFPEVNIRSKMPGNFMVEHTTRQIIFVEDEDQKRPLWLSTHTGIKPVSTYNKKLASLNCDLTSPLAHFEFTHEYNPDRRHSAASICRWEEDFEIYKIEE
ncbi:hypothetical protein SG34_028355 [Thalassomonas viridans]|uniref:DUF6795 domain-containing protein n=1 Tax=Thalassomonas viridans TaxID=137584 RepID=A0AAE9Z4U1_9GAMM|nr:DUF6795 domain-containing protein [Thalassomonas viridans]WDE05162.1 hypothetical protein SG34_028355 [Thalassomonas viridans]